MIAFRYRKEYSKLFGIVYRPVAEVYFRDADGRDMISFMYVDSGADITLLPRELGESLGLTIEEEKIQEISGVGGGSIPVIIKTIEMRIGDHVMNAKVAWSLEEDVPALLGRMDIFNDTRISFIHNEKVTFEFDDAE